MSEHRLIEQVLTIFNERLAAPGPIPAEFVEQALDFFANFADGLHHYKEEIALFPALEAAGVGREHGPIGCMLQEHDTGRNYLKGIRENLAAARAGDATAAARIRSAAAAYVQMLRDHIWKEDQILFEMARQVLDETAVEKVLAEFGNPAIPQIAPEVRARYEELAASLAAAAASD